MQKLSPYQNNFKKSNAVHKTYINKYPLTIAPFGIPEAFPIAVNTKLDD